MRLKWMSRLITAGVVVTLVVVAGITIYSKVPDPTIRGSFKTFAMFHDGSRMQVDSPVIIAGVRVGDISKLSIEGRLARVDMNLRADVQLPADTTFVTRRSDSLFGDSYVEIIPGEAVEGARMLKSGEQIPHVQEGGSTDTVLRAMTRALPKIDNALDIVHERMVDGRPFVQGPVRLRLEEAERWLAEGHIEAPLTRAERAMERMERGTDAIASAIATDGRRVPQTLARFNKRVLDARAGMADARRQISTSLGNAREGMSSIDQRVDEVAEVLGAIDRGEGDDWKGSLGRLVNDPQLAEDIEDVTEGLKEATASFDRFKTWLGVRTELNTISGDFRFYVTAEIRARNDKFYLVEIERSSLGSHSDQIADATATGDYTRTQVIHDTPRFTLQFGKRFGMLQVRGGLKDSTFGLGADMLFLEGRLRLSGDIFGSMARAPRVKLAGAFAVFRQLYVIAGIDDALNDHVELDIISGNSPAPKWFDRLHYGRDYFLGAALQFDDADLSTLLRLYGALLIGLL